MSCRYYVKKIGEKGGGKRTYGVFDSEEKFLLETFETKKSAEIFMANKLGLTYRDFLSQRKAGKFNSN